MTLNEFRDYVAETIMPGLDFLKRALLVGLLNSLTPESYAVIEQIAREVGEAHARGGLPAVRQLLREYDVPDELAGLLDDETKVSGWLKEVGLPADLLGGLSAAPDSNQVE